jgi:tetrahydromethanopterin S-methyltransferase subunit A
MINNENLDENSKKISECIEEDPGCFEKEPMIVQLNEKEEEEEEVKSFEQENISASSIDSSSLYLLGIENRIRSMKLEINEIGSFEKFSSGYYAGKIQGIVIGFILTLVLVMILFWSLRL